MNDIETLKNLQNIDIVIGIQKTILNATQLYEEASILEKKLKICRAYTLYQLSIEEFGKAYLLWELLMQKILKETIDYKQFREQFKNHSSKTDVAIKFTEFLFDFYEDQTGNSAANLKKYFSKLNKTGVEANTLKNSSLYVSFDKKGFTMPEETIKSTMLSTIKKSCSNIRTSCSVFSNINSDSLTQLENFVKAN